MYKRRIKVFMVAVAIAFVILTARLVHMQLVEGGRHRRHAGEFLWRYRLLPAMRGRILDRHGSILAMDNPCFELCLDYPYLAGRFAAGADNAVEISAAFRKKNVSRWRRAQVKRISRTEDVPRDEAERIYTLRGQRTWQLAEALAAENGQDLADAAERIVRRVEGMRSERVPQPREQGQPHPVVTGLDETVARDVTSKLDETVGAYLRPSHNRRYPYGDLACHVIGLMGPIYKEEEQRLNLREGQADWLTRRRENYLPSDRIGKRGVEKMLEKTLRGRRGSYSYNWSSGKVEDKVAAVHGRDVKLTLDIELQRRLTELIRDPKGNLSEKGRPYEGSAVVLSIPNGEILALVSVPTFDLNTYREDYRRLVDDELYLPLMHRAVGGLYPPGSTVKTASALIALGAGEISLATKFHCRGYYKSPEVLRCWTWELLHGGHPGISHLNVTEAIKHSCNVFFANVGDRLGPQRTAAGFRRLFGFADPPGTGLPGERRGTAPTRQQMFEKAGRGYYPGEGRFMCIGQGMLTGTPLHVANMVATIARGASLTPTVILDPNQKRQPVDLGFSAEHLAAVRAGMYKVVNEAGGTAIRKFRYPNGNQPAAVVCGKTGTAQINDRTADLNGDGRISPSERLTGSMGWFVGYAPRENPQVAFAIVLEFVDSGPERAAPLACRLVEICEEMGYVQ